LSEAVVQLGNDCTEYGCSIHLPSNVRRCDHCLVLKRPMTVEFASQSQHETFSDSVIELTNDINDLENKSRKRSLSLLYER